MEDGYMKVVLILMILMLMCTEKSCALCVKQLHLCIMILGILCIHSYAETDT